MAEHKGEQGTGKHPHKDTEEPYPHHEDHTTKEGHSQNASSRSHEKSGSHESSRDESESEDLKSREYRDAQGNVHHHTHTAGKS